MIAVVDIGGVLADPGHRLHHLDGPQKNWPMFFGALRGDAVIPRGRDLVRTLYVDGNVVILLTGRPERTRAPTIEWLSERRIPFSQLWMRPNKDRSPARDFKAWRLRESDLRPSDVDLLVDDSWDVVRHLAKAGYPAVLWPTL